MIGLLQAQWELGGAGGERRRAAGEEAFGVAWIPFRELKAPWNEFRGSGPIEGIVFNLKVGIGYGGEVAGESRRYWRRGGRSDRRRERSRRPFGRERRT